MTPEKLHRYFGKITGYRLLFRRGMYSDDAEHAFITAQALIVSGGEVEAFRKELARQLRIWFLLLPGGAGLATLKACCKLILGVSPQRSGVFSAGNGPAMRAAILGVFAHEAKLSNEHLIELNRASARITHIGPKAEYGALAVALAARYGLENKTINADDFFQFFIAHFPFTDEAAREMTSLIGNCVDAVKTGLTTHEFCAAQGWAKGASGYIYHTVPAALHAWLSYPDDYRMGVLETIRCGGDTDSTAAIAGGLIGARNPNIPPEWREGLCEWPRVDKWMQKLSVRLRGVSVNQQPQKLISTFWPGVLARNIWFLLVVLLHGFRRLIPL
jgi:ADP-ribosyl-[dinitrogen reductase] hydrolase